VRMVATSSAVVAGSPNLWIDFKYDYLGRRVEKKVTNQASNGGVIVLRRYLYDGWSLIAEYSVGPQSSALSLLRSFTWGLDIARSMTDAGGVGALLQIADYASGKTYLPTYDGNGNIVSLINGTSGAIAATYEYSPYGEQIRADVNDSAIADQPFRFSTKYYDGETGLYDYGHRLYSPSQGRFLGRDPTEEKGGLHLYAFCMNNAINGYDVLGNRWQFDPNSNEYDPTSHLPGYEVPDDIVTLDPVTANGYTAPAILGGSVTFSGGGNGSGSSSSSFIPFNVNGPLLAPGKAVKGPDGNIYIVTKPAGLGPNGEIAWEALREDLYFANQRADLAADFRSLMNDLKASPGQVAANVATGAIVGAAVGTAVVVTGPIGAAIVLGAAAGSTIGTYSDMNNNPGNYTPGQVANFTGSNIGGVIGGVGISQISAAAAPDLNLNLNLPRTLPGDPNFVGPVAPWQVRPAGVPGNWVGRPAENGLGTQFTDPTNPHNWVRVMAGNPASRFPNSQSPYVRWQANGQALDVNGNELSTRKSPDAHIPIPDFRFTPDPFQ
jgi:RHS repeat-associated protein